MAEVVLDTAGFQPALESGSEKSSVKFSLQSVEYLTPALVSDRSG